MLKPFLALLTSEQAYAELAKVEPLAVEEVGARDALGRVLAEAVTANEDVPHFFRSNMDGYAVRAADTAGASETSTVALALAGEVAMGEQALDPVAPGSTIRVSTGAMMPPGADAVVIVEHTEERRGSVVVAREAAPGANTIAIGEDLRRGDPVFAAGHRLRGSDVGVLTGVGRSRVRVHRVARVGVAATGDEIVEPEDELPPGRVRNVNQYLLGSMTRALGAAVVDYGVVRDEEQALDRLLASACAECDVLLLSGGSSKGTKDLVSAAIGRLAGAKVRFHGIAIAPGKPTMFATAGDLAILGVPGNPAAAAVVHALFASALIRLREGEPLARILATRPRVRARLAQAVTSTPGREDFLRVRLEAGGASSSDCSLVAVPQRGKSVAISTIARADGLLAIPRSSEGLEAGTEVEVLLLR